MLKILCVLGCCVSPCSCLITFYSILLLITRLNYCWSRCPVIDIIVFQFLWIFAFSSIRKFAALAQYTEKNNKAGHLKLNIFVRFFNAIFVWWRAAQGFGTSKNKQSAFTFIPSTEKPSATTSLQVDVIFFFYKFSKNSFVISALSLLN